MSKWHTKVRLLKKNPGERVKITFLDDPYDSPKYHHYFRAKKSPGREISPIDRVLARLPSV